MTHEQIIARVAEETGCNHPRGSVRNDGGQNWVLSKSKKFIYTYSASAEELAGDTVYSSRRGYLNTREEVVDPSVIEDPRPVIDRVLELCHDHGLPEPVYHIVPIQIDDWRNKDLHWLVRFVVEPWQPTSWAPPELMAKIHQCLKDGSWKVGYATSRKSESKLYKVGEEVTTKEHRKSKHRYYFVTSCRGYCGAFCLMRDDGRLVRVAYKLIRVPKKEESNAG